MHDLARLISQESDHDDFDPQKFDSPVQSIVRLVDLGGKVDLKTEQLRETIDSLREFSKKVQMSYLEKGDPIWADMDNPEEAIENYIQKEAKALKAAKELNKKDPFTGLFIACSPGRTRTYNLEVNSFLLRH